MPVHAWHVAVVEVDDAHAVTNAESWVGVQALSTWAGVTNAGTSELDTLDAGVGQTGPTPPLLEPLPELEPEEPPELEPLPPPELDPEEPPELEPPPPPELDPEEPPELPPLPPPEPLPEPEPLPLPLPPPLLDPELLPLPDPEPLVQAWVAARLQDVVSAHEAQLKVCAPTV